MKKPDKFQVGDTAWLPGDWRGHDRNRLVPYQVIERIKTGYVMQPLGTQIGTLNLAERVSTVKANRDYYTTQAKEDWEWQRENRRKIVAKVECADAATLRQIARLFYVPEATR